MKSLSEELQNFDRENFRRMAHGLPEIQDEKSGEEQTAEIINALFGQLRAAFPAAMNNFRTQEEFNEFRRQWLMSFKENGITTMQQVAGGMRVSRRQEKPFLPSPGQFVAWCKAEQATAAGLPNAHDLVDMVYEYCRNRGQYPDAESYPWKSNAHYWLVTTLYANMRANSLSDTELRRKAADELNHMAARINRGDRIPEPVKQLPVLGGKSLTRTQGLAKIAELREKHGLRGRKS